MPPLPSGKTLSLLLSAALLAGAGCRNVAEHIPQSPLKPARMSAESCVLDVFFVRVPFGDSEVNGPLWTEIDEQQLTSDLRQRLALNGFRIGLVGTQVPPALAKLLEQQGKTPGGSQAAAFSPEDLEEESPVEWAHWQLPPGRRKEIVCSETYESLPVLVCDPQGVQGDEYSDAQGVLAVQSYPEADGRVRLRFVPEIQHGERKLRFVGKQGIARLEPTRAKRSFNDMAVEATLGLGQMLVLSCETSRPGSLGHRFFSCQKDGKQEQKLLVIRLSQTQHDDLFSPPQLLPLDTLASDGP